MLNIQLALQKAKSNANDRWKQTDSTPQRAAQQVTRQPTAVPSTSPVSAPAPVHALPVARPLGENWESLKQWAPDDIALRENRVVTLDHSDAARPSFDMLRTKLLQVLRQNNWKSIAITSPTAACGKSTVSANLAFSLSHQVDCRTVLLDFDLRRPSVAKTLGMKNPPSMEEFLSGKASVNETFVRYGSNLAIAANDKSVTHASELLQSATAKAALSAMQVRLEPDVVLYDLPPMLAFDDVMAFAPSVDCALIVTAAEMTTGAEADICEYELSQRTKVLGVVLNKCRFTPEKYGY
ncbi:MAG: CpsD/CapB family tyrosine-protein kinase [Rhizobiaceae bacterium]|nr:CpsD/CapB family tyrosine-protein kinase [Rhizobiaceae bacterium]